jgi:hypothetical protein
LNVVQVYICLSEKCPQGYISLSCVVTSQYAPSSYVANILSPTHTSTVNNLPPVNSKLDASCTPQHQSNQPPPVTLEMETSDISVWHVISTHAMTHPATLSSKIRVSSRSQIVEPWTRESVEILWSGKGPFRQSLKACMRNRCKVVRGMPCTTQWHQIV